MNRNAYLCAAALAGLLVAFAANGCSETRAKPQSAEEVAASLYKTGHGLKLSPAAVRFLEVQQAEFAGKLRAAALLRTVKGDFVYVENDGWLLRTAVTVGPETPQGFDVKSGLYEGDRIVTAGVRGLWLTELAAINGGVGCADGH